MVPGGSDEPVDPPVEFRADAVHGLGDLTRGMPCKVFPEGIAENPASGLAHSPREKFSPAEYVVGN